MPFFQELILGKYLTHVMHNQYKRVVNNLPKRGIDTTSQMLYLSGSGFEIREISNFKRTPFL
jgi:hypothetical protein